MNKIPTLPFVQLIPFAEIEEKRPALLITSAPAWEAVEEHLRGLPVAQKIEVTKANTEHWDSLLLSIGNRNLEVIYAVGGGLTADAGKYIAARLNLPFVVLPTALSVDAFLTYASGIRRNGCVYYIETRSPETLILDLAVIACAPDSIRAAGITDVMSIATGSWDWRFAHEQGKNPPGMEFIPWVYENARTILGAVLDCAEAAGRGDRDGLRTLYDCLAMEVQLCNQVGHARPEEGSEHYFAYAVENLIGHGLPHADLVGPGIMIMARLQGQDTSRLEKALLACHVPLHNIPLEFVERTLLELPAYCEKHKLSFGIAHTLGG